ncbi:EAL domain-containing protein [Seleniivibrio sp.]|uniref:EAL domain-containing protein n=1 Tax=Seleniivibrio sp. TaxID=2898801 RepID=UPI0025CBA1FE|nr:EAL domain-containing protein [Seleniivibrio sp.]MCD8553347.1 EAL domain-containing protein [Seleniivibrio sp.]
MKIRLSTVTLITAISVAVIFSLTLIYNLSSLSEKHIKRSETELKRNYEARQKEVIRNEVQRCINRIKQEQSEVYGDAKTAVRDRVDSADEYMKILKAGGNSDKAIRTALDSLIHSFKWEFKTGYYYALDQNGIIISHGGNSKYEGINAVSLVGNTQFNQFIKRAYEEGSAYGEYEFEKPNESGKKYSKIAYAKYNPDTKILIAAGIYLDEIAELAKGDILASIKKDRFGTEDTGYFWIISTDYKNIFYPDKTIGSADIRTVTSGDGRKIFLEAIEMAKTQGEGYISYQWKLPDKDEYSEKTSYISYVPEWEWVIGTGFYYVSLNELIESEKKAILGTSRQELYSNIVLITILLVFSMAASIFVFRRMREVEDKQSKILNDLKQYKFIMDESAIVSMTDPTGIITYVNDQFCTTSGYTREQLVGRKHNILRHPDTPSEYFAELWKTIARGKIFKGIIKNLRPDGSHYYHNVVIIPIKDENEKIVAYTSCSQDVTEVIENRKRLQVVFNTDKLTGLGNRYKLQQDIETSKRPCLAILDIDRFHEINELYGMKLGDRLLAMFADRLVKNSHLKTFELYRLHSDVFAVLAPYMDLMTFTEIVKSSLATITKEYFVISDKEMILSCCIGFADSTRSDIMAEADIAVQQAKFENKAFQVFDPNLKDNFATYEQNIKILKMLNDAVDKDRTVPFFQPIYAFSTKGIWKYECLMRIIGENGEVISPAQFLDVSKQTRLYPRLTLAVVKKSIDMFKKVNAEFSVNLSVEDLLNEETMNEIFRYASNAGIMSRMVIEIVETERLTGDENILNIISRFKQNGTKIAIDDFGSGYSNFDYLLKVQADYVKIDASIIRLISKDERASDIVRSITSYAKKMKMQTIAEFIADEATAKKAKELGVDFAQGYWFGKPEPEPATEPEHVL